MSECVKVNELAADLLLALSLRLAPRPDHDD